MKNVPAAALIATLALIPVAGKAAQPAVCTAEHQSPSIVKLYPVDTPAFAKMMNLTGTTRVQVDISAAGRVTGSSVAKSSGYGILDNAAVQAIASMNFHPETNACDPLAGSYAVDVEFAND